MTVNQLKEYLGIALDIEKNIFLQNKLLTELKQEIERLKQPKHIPDPQEPKFTPFPPDKSVNLGTDFLVGLGILLFLGFISCTIYFVIGWENESLIADLLFIAGIIAPFAIMILDAYETKKSNQVKNEQCHREYSKYKSEREEYQKILEANKLERRLDQQRRQRQTELYEAQCKQITDFLTASKQHLKIIYAKNIIFPKYRNLVMVCSIYEYICAGRCTTLEGHEGAYNILEMEIRLDRIITQLDKVIAQLDAIQANQYMLYSAIQEANQQSYQLLKSTRHIAEKLQDLNNHLDNHSADLANQISELQKTSALTAYHVERTQKELHYMNRMDYLTGRNDGVFFNQPPM